MLLSIIIPVRNEAPILPGLLAHLRPLQQAGCDIIFADGNSDDGSARLIRQAGFRVLLSPPGRARQMNAGAQAASGDALLFLHADTRLPPAAASLVAQALAGKRTWGRFDVRITGRRVMLPVVAMMMNLRSRMTGIASGDQALFVRRDVFCAIGGFPEQPLMEDIELSKRLLRLSPPACLRQKVITSGRRWEQYGVWRTIFLMWRLRWAYWRGVPASELAKSYS